MQARALAVLVFSLSLSGFADHAERKERSVDDGKEFEALVSNEAKEQLENVVPGSDQTKAVKAKILELLKKHNRPVESIDDFGVNFMQKSGSAWMNGGKNDTKAFISVYYPKAKPTEAMLIYPNMKTFVKIDLKDARATHPVHIFKIKSAKKKLDGLPLVVVTQSGKHPRGYIGNQEVEFIVPKAIAGGAPSSYTFKIKEKQLGISEEHLIGVSETAKNSGKWVIEEKGESDKDWSQEESVERLAGNQILGLFGDR